MIGLGCQEVVILLVLFAVPVVIALRLSRRKRNAEKSAEDDAGW